MRTISICGFLMGLFVMGYSLWRWGGVYMYDSPFRTIVGLFIALSIMAWAYVLDWMTMKEKELENLAYRIDSLQYPARDK